MDNFQDKVVVITGGGTGIGLAFARQFGKEGAKLVLAGRRQEKIDEAVASLKETGVEAAGTVCDTSDIAQVEALADFAWDTFGQADVILNNAGISDRPRPVLRSKFEDVKKVMDINFYGVWNGVTVFGSRFMRQKTPAAIYNIGSENSLFNAVPFNFSYVVSKHAVYAMTEALREEVPEFIDVSIICPGLVSTDMTSSFAPGMDADKFAGIAMQQLKANKFYVVTHAYNMERIDARYKEVSEAYAEYAPRYAGDDEFDIRNLIKKQRGGE